MPLPVYEKVFSAAEKGFISETYENLCCLENLSENFSPNCVRTLDRGFDANGYYRYFLKHGERFVIRTKKNRNVIYNGKTLRISRQGAGADSGIWLWRGAHAPAFQSENAGEEKAVPHHCKGVSAPVAHRRIFQIQETAA